MSNKISNLNNFALYLYCFSIPVESLNFIYLERNFSAAFVCAVLFFLSAMLNFREYLNIEKTKYFLYPIILYALLIIFSSLINLNEFSSRFFDQKFILNIIMFHILLVAISRNTVNRENAMMSFAFGIVIVAILSLFGIGVEYNQDARLSWMLSNRDEFPLKVLSAFIIFSLVLFGNKKRFDMKNILLCFSLPLLIWLLIEIGSRTALIILLIILIFDLFFVRNNKKNLFILFVFAFGPLIIFYMDANDVQSRFEYTFSEVTKHILETKEVEYDNDALGGRLYTWINMFPMFLERPIIGNGLSGFDYQMLKIFPERQSDTPHNEILNSLILAGIIGFVVYLIFLYRILKSTYLSFKYRSQIDNILFLLIIALGYVSTLHPNHDKGFWFILALVASSIIRQDEIKKFNSILNKDI